MNTITVESIAKRYGYHWIIKDYNDIFFENQTIGIAGHNGSGKSTLIKLLSGYLSPTKGVVLYTIDNNKILRNHIYKYLSLAAPYTDLIQEFTVREMFEFQKKFKPFLNNMSFEEFQELLSLPSLENKSISQFSSGMKQKAQLAFSILADTKILLLDEPTSFLDEKNKIWFSKILSMYSEHKIVIIASNDKFDLDLCDEVRQIV